ncbi:MAG: hypothetical protein V8S69_01640 [Dakarella massiliensis]
MTSSLWGLTDNNKFESAVLGSVAAHVLAATTIPVMVIRTAARLGDRP